MATPDPDSKFPPGAWLGYGIDLTSANPTDIKSLSANILKMRRLVSLNTDGNDKTIGKITWTVPTGVDMSGDEQSSEGSYQHWDTGTSLTSDIQGSADLSAKYLAFSGDIAGSYSVSKNFKGDRQYALFDYAQTLLGASFSNYGDNIDAEYLKRWMNAVQPFDSTNADSIKRYKSMFHDLGSHIVVGTTYGGRLALTVWSDNATDEEKSSFTSNVSAAYNGLTSSGKFDASIKSSSDYLTFDQQRGQSITCTGGDLSIAGKIQASPQSDNVYNNFLKWRSVADTNPDLMSVETVTLWDLLTGTVDIDLMNWASQVQTAFSYIVNNPSPHRTTARLVINSDWGEIALNSPAAYILPDDDPNNTLPDGVVLSPTKVMFGAEYSHKSFRELTVNFIIMNDGSPVDFTLSHGSAGSTGGNGNISVTFSGITYSNTKRTDNKWNSQSYVRCIVNPAEYSSTLVGPSVIEAMDASPAVKSSISTKPDMLPIDMSARQAIRAG